MNGQLIKNMPKIGMKPVRRQQLIDATMASVAANGLHNTTINSISRLAGLSSGIISHYFGGKQELIEATLRHLLEQLKLALLAQTAERQLSSKARLHAIVAANFTEFQRSGAATRTWLNFWAQSMHEPGLPGCSRSTVPDCRVTWPSLSNSYCPGSRRSRVPSRWPP